MSATELSTNSIDSIAASFQAYLNYAYSQPILSAEKERELFLAYIQDNDLQSVREIVLSHLRFVVFIAKRYVGYGLPMEDLVQEGTVGLMKSVKKFNLSYGVRFASFAVHLIRAEIQEYVLKNWKLVRVATTKAQRKLFFNLRSFKKRIGRMNSDEIKEVANYLNVGEQDVVLMESRLHQVDEFFEDVQGDAGGDEYVVGAEHSALLTESSYCPEMVLANEDFNQKCMDSIKAYIETLDERAKDILVSRWMGSDEASRVSLKALAEKYAISVERVRQIEARAFQKLKDYMLKRGLKLDEWVVGT